ncbi:MAG: extracellular solute-binding protein [Acidobacteria bacterium]|nr:extracellular solute-binding protein [Acidobacteriota bacterium]
MTLTTWNAINTPFSRRTLLGGAIASAALGLTACSGGGNSTATASELSTVKIMAPFLSTQAPTADSAVQKKLESLMGKKIDITWVPNSSYADKTNIVLAGSDLPHIMVVQTKSPSFVKSAESGAFWELTDKLKDYPNLNTNQPDIQLNSSVNGKVYGVFRSRAPMRTAVMFRKDWLDKLGLKVPTTTQELYEVAKAFTEGDPNGDGKGDTTGIVIPKWGGLGTNSPYDVMEEWYGAGNRWTERDGKLIPSFETSEFLDANRFIKKMVDEKLINADFATYDSTKWNDAFINGKAGIIIDVDSRISQLIGLFKAADASTYQNKVAYTGNLKGPDGKLHAHPSDGYAGFLSIPKSTVRTEADLKKVLDVLNTMNDKDVAVLINNGIEDVNFKLVDGRAATITPPTPESKAVSADIASYSQLGTNVNGNHFYDVKQASDYEQKVYDDRVKLMADDLKSAVYNPAAPYISDTYVAKGVQLDNIVADARIKYLAGQLDENGLKDAIKQWDTAGGSKVKDEINKLWQENKK